MDSHYRHAVDLDQRGVEAHNAGRYSAAARDHKESAVAYVAAGDLRAASGQRLQQADSLLAAGKPDEALTTARIAGDIAEQVDDAVLAGEACYLSARALVRLDRADEALTCCAEGRALYARADSDPGVRRTALDEFEVALRHFMRADRAAAVAWRVDLVEAPPIGHVPVTTA